jgi:hypothetical protein
MQRIIKLKPLQPPLLLQIRRLQQILRNLPLTTRKPLATRQLHAAIAPYLNRRNPFNGCRVAVPRILVFVDLGWKGGDVELEGLRAPDAPWGATHRIRVDGEAEAAEAGAIGGDVKGGFSPDLWGKVSGVNESREVMVVRRARCRILSVYPWRCRGWLC